MIEFFIIVSVVLIIGAGCSASETRTRTVRREGLEMKARNGRLVHVRRTSSEREE